MEVVNPCLVDHFLAVRHLAEEIPFLAGQIPVAGLWAAVNPCLVDHFLAGL